MQKNSDYNNSIGYLKALGITLMVFGHTGNTLLLKDFVYMFHMPLFFIASGFCFKERKLNEPTEYLYRKIKNIWWPFVKWSLLFLCLHNFFFHLNLYNDQYGYWNNVSYLYSIEDIKQNAFAIMFKMQKAEQLLGGYWFLNALFWGSLIFFSALRLVKSTLYVGGILFCICVFFNQTCLHIPFFQFSAQTFAAALFITIGYAFAKYRIQRFNYWQILGGLSLTAIGSFFWKMEMNHDSYSNSCFIPYVITASIATWCFFSMFEHLQKKMALLTFIGKNTLTILTWHFLSFKFVSLYIICLYKLPIERLAEFPVIREYASQGWWVVYFFVAMFVTCLMALCNKLIKNSWLQL